MLQHTFFVLRLKLEMDFMNVLKLKNTEHNILRLQYHNSQLVQFDKFQAWINVFSLE